jgi:hypothetical protein
MLSPNSPLHRNDSVLQTSPRLIRPLGRRLEGLLLLLVPLQWHIRVILIFITTEDFGEVVASPRNALNSH